MGLFGLSKTEKGIWNTIQKDNVVKIHIKDNPQEKYYSKVEEVADSYLSIVTPIIGTMLLELPINLVVEVEIYTPDGGRVRFISKVISQEWMKDRTIQFALPRSLERIQLRAFYRLEMVLDVEYSLFLPHELPPRGLELRYPLFLGLTKDISEGGALLIVDKPLEKGANMNMKIKLPDNNMLRARAKVLRTEELNVRGKFGAGVEFSYMSEEDREILRRFIFLRSRERYKNFRQK